MKLASLYIIVMWLSFNLKAQPRNYFLYNAGFVPQSFSDTNNDQYFIAFDSTIKREKYGFFNSSFLTEYSNTYSYSNTLKELNSKLLDASYIDLGHTFFASSILSNDSFFAIFNKYSQKTYTNNTPTKCFIKNYFNSNNFIVNSDSNNLFLFCYFNIWNVNAPSCLRSGYFKFKNKTNLNNTDIQYVQLTKNYSKIFYQPHYSDLDKKWIICRDTLGYDIYLLEGDSLKFSNRYEHQEKLIDLIADFNSKSGWLSISHSSVGSKYSLSNTLMLKSELKLIDSTVLYSFYSFDNLTGNLKINQFNYLNPPTYKSIYDMNRKEDLYFYTFPVDMEFSSNDSILYVLNGYGIRGDPFYCFYNKNTPTEIIQIKWQDSFQINKIVIDDQQLPVYNDIELAADGKLYVSKSIGYFDSVSCSFNSNRHSSLSSIPFPNEFTSKCGYINDALPNVKAKSYPVDCYRLPEFFGRFSRLDFSKKVNCNGICELTITNSENWKYFDWFIENDSIRTSDDYLSYKCKNSGIIKVKLKGYNKQGYIQWYSDTIHIRKKPIANFKLKSTEGCQFVTFDLLDSGEVFQVKTDSFIKKTWVFGDNEQVEWRTKNIKELKNQSHVYKNNGKYVLKYIINDGYCSDTFTRTDSVKILKAPRPGIISSPNIKCAPLKLFLKRKYTDDLDSAIWQDFNGMKQKTLNFDSLPIKIDSSGLYKYTQTLYGRTGCITKDTIVIDVLKGIDKNIRPNIIRATVVQENVILIHWNKILNANYYQLYRDNILLGKVTDSFYLDTAVNTNLRSYNYKVLAVDVCNQTSLLSNEARSIFLSAKVSNSNFCVLSWNNYSFWKQGVESCQIFSIKDNVETLINITIDSQFLDKNYLIEGGIEKCFKVIAVEKSNTTNKSVSNVICLPYESIVWIPSALSINGDGLNEGLRITTYGIKSFVFTVFNRWGEPIYKSNSIFDEWKPTSEEQGVYMYTLNAISNNGNFVATGTITLLR